MDGELYNDFGRRPILEEFLEKTRHLQRDGWEVRMFMTFIDAETNVQRTYGYTLNKGSEFVVYDEFRGEILYLMFDETGRVAGTEPVIPEETAAIDPLTFPDEPDGQLSKS